MAKPLVVAAGLLASAPFLYVAAGWLPILFREHKLLHWTDHDELLSACREVMSKRGAYRANPDVGGGGSENERRVTFPDPRDPAMPRVIQDLAPTYLIVEQSRLSLQMGGGMHHYGVIAFQAAVAETRLPEGAEQLEDGLWYYSE